MFSPTQMGQIYLIFNQLPFLWDTSVLKNAITGEVAKDDKGNEAGKGHLDNEDEIKAKEWKYEVEKRH